MDLESLEFEFRVACWVENELKIDYNDPDKDIKIRNRRLLHNTLHYVNCFFLKLSGAPLLHTSENACQDGLMWEQLHFLLENKARETLSNDDIVVPILQIIVNECESYGADELIHESQFSKIWQ
jgi:hypothetical protein